MQRLPPYGFPQRSPMLRMECPIAPHTVQTDTGRSFFGAFNFSISKPFMQDSATWWMPGYQTKQERIAIAGADDLVIRALLDRQQFFDPFGEAHRLGISSAAWPLFGLLWPSGLQLAARMALKPVCSSERILEIGCGLALASLVGHRRGADVTASDCHPLAASFLEENLRLNDLAAMKYRHGHWSDPELPPGRESASGLCVVRGRYDLIIGSDVLYERGATADLAGFIARHLSPAGEVRIIDPERGNRPAFNRQMAARGFLMREERLNRPSSVGAAAYKGRLLFYRRAAEIVTLRRDCTPSTG